MGLKSTVFYDEPNKHYKLSPRTCWQLPKALIVPISRIIKGKDINIKEI